jgi:hypothetical protein
LKALFLPSVASSTFYYMHIQDDANAKMATKPIVPSKVIISNHKLHTKTTSLAIRRQHKVSHFENYSTR